MSKPVLVAIPIGAFLALLGLGLAAPAVASVLDLALPFFGLIVLGFICGQLKAIPEEGLAWMNFFIVYAALPALFFTLISKTPIAELSRWSFIAATLGCTIAMYALATIVGRLVSGESAREGAIQALVGAYSNVGYMGPGLTLAALGPQSIVPTALIFVFDNMFFFAVTPFVMTLASASRASLGDTAWLVVRRIATHPFNIATAIAVAAAWAQWQPPAPVGKILTYLSGAAAPCALFTMGVTVALRPMKRVAVELPALLLVKLVVHPLAVWLLLTAIGGFGRVWTFTAVLMAALPPALNVFVMASQYGVYIERASSAILVGTIVSVATVTALLYAISTGMLPSEAFWR
jgi:malonate transporter